MPFKLKKKKKKKKKKKVKVRATQFDVEVMSKMFMYFDADLSTEVSILNRKPPVRLVL